MNIYEALALNPGCTAEISWADEVFAAGLQADPGTKPVHWGWRLPMPRISKSGKRNRRELHMA